MLNGELSDWRGREFAAASGGAVGLGKDHGNFMPGSRQRLEGGQAKFTATGKKNSHVGLIRRRRLFGLRMAVASRVVRFFEFTKRFSMLHLGGGAHAVDDHGAIQVVKFVLPDSGDVARVCLFDGLAG